VQRLSPKKGAKLRTGAARGGGASAGIRNLYSYVTSSGDIRYDNRSYADMGFTLFTDSEGRSHMINT